MEYIDLTASETLAALESGSTRSVELAERLIARTEAAAALNCYVSFDAAGLLKQAADADARRAAGQRLPLLGSPSRSRTTSTRRACPVATARARCTAGFRLAMPNSCSACAPPVR